MLIIASSNEVNINLNHSSRNMRNIAVKFLLLAIGAVTPTAARRKFTTCTTTTNGAKCLPWGSSQIGVTSLVGDLGIRNPNEKANYCVVADKVYGVTYATGSVCALPWNGNVKLFECDSSCKKRTGSGLWESKNLFMGKSSKKKRKPKTKPKPKSKSSKVLSSEPSFLPSFVPTKSFEPSISSEPSISPSTNGPTNEPTTYEPTMSKSSKKKLKSKSQKAKSSKVPSSEPSLQPSTKLGGKSVATFEVTLGLEGDIDVPSMDLSDAAAMFESVIADLLPPPGSVGNNSRSAVVTQSIGGNPIPLTISRRKLQTEIDVVLLVTISVLCSSEEACEDTENALKETAKTVAVDIETQSDAITTNIQSNIEADPITGLNSISTVTSIASDPTVDTTFGSDEPSSEPSLAPSKSSQPSTSPSLVPSKPTEPTDVPSLVPSKSSKPSNNSSLVPSTSSQPSDTASLAPSKSSQPSSISSLAPSKSSQPSSVASLAPSKSSEPSVPASLAPSKSSQPSSLASLAPSKSSQPSSISSLAPSKSSQPSSISSLAPSKSSAPSLSA